MEQEADRIADQVLAGTGPKAPPHIQRVAGPAAAGTGVAPASVERVLAGPGQSLDHATQRDMGRRFGYDFSGVRVHTGGDAERSAHDVNAHAYTVGRNVVFGAGQFAPGTRAGRHLIAHELTHVLQQTGAAGVGEAGSIRELPHSAHASTVVAREDAGTPDPVRGAQVECVRRLGGCPNSRPGGIPTAEEISSYNSECRGETGYGGGDVTPTEEECQHGAAMPIRSRSITVLDWGESWNVFNVAGGLLTLGEIDAAGVRDMVDQIKNTLAPPPQPECIGDLTIIGHGSPGSISVGDGTDSISGRYIGGGTLDPSSPAFDPALRATLAELTPLFCDTASVTLRGCNVGDGAVGAGFVQRLADLWGVPVRAHQGVVRAGGYWTSGRWTRATPTPPAAATPPPGGP